MADKTDGCDGADTQSAGTGGEKTINDPLTRSEEEAPRREFEGIKPE